MTELQDIIEVLLTKRDEIVEQEAAEIATAISKIKEKYEVRANKITVLLQECGYEEINPHSETNKIAEQVGQTIQNDEESNSNSIEQ